MICRIRLAAAVLVLMGIASCSLAPAKLRVISSKQQAWISAQNDPVDDALVTLVDEIERDPESEKSHALLAALIAHSRKHISKTKTEDREKVRLAKHVKLTFLDSVPGSYKQDYFDDLTPASDYKVMKIHHHTRPGVGLPMIGVRDVDDDPDGMEKHYSPEGIVRPVTAVAEVVHGSGGMREVQVRLLSPLYYEEVRLHGKTQPMAADFSAAWAELLTHTGKLKVTGLTSVLRAEPKRDSELYLMEPYDPRKKPLLMVHGFLSTPLGWAGITNDLWADPYVRQHYQIWHYHYPTSAPFLYSAMIFRRHLDEVKKQIRADGYGEIQPITILAHSMGGLMSKTVITNSGEAVWKTVMRVPLSELKATAEDKKEVDEILHWKARTDVHRVIFSSVPHWGSGMSKDWIGRTGAKLMKLPPSFVGLYDRLDRDNPDALTTEFKNALAKGRLTSIDTLSPDHPLLPVMNRMPIVPWVTVHSIIGNRGSKKPLERTTDGVVPYLSAHWPGAVSEVVVPSWHGSFKHPEAIKEVERILKLP